MKFSVTTLTTLLLASGNLTNALPTIDSSATLNTITITTSHLFARYFDTEGTCSKSSCRRHGWPHGPFNCYNSACGADDDGKSCSLGSLPNGTIVAQCPVNNLSYAWDWPWLDCMLKQNRDKGTCKTPACDTDAQKKFWNCVHPGGN